jgi:hypothetical protein
MTRKRRAIGATLASLAVLGLPACSSSPHHSAAPPPPPAVGIVAETGFSPTANGFSFQNYGTTLSDGSTVPSNLTSADVQTIFGNIVCADAAIGKCDLIPEATAWMNQMNQEMADGHCFGFSVAADLVWQEKLNTSTYGAPKITGLDIYNNSVLQRIIARGWVFQTFASEQAQKITGDPNKILTKLEQVLKPNASQTYTVTIWKSDGSGGHAITPYAVKYNGNGQYSVLIYDNNWPGDTTRAISFDTNKDSWSYQASSNPTETDSLYQGDAGSNSIMLFPTPPGQVTWPCPFCGNVPKPGSTAGATGSAVRTAAIYLAGSVTNHSHVLVTDQKGRHLGNVNGKIVNQIPGATYVLLTSDQTWKNKLEPILFVPANQAYTITLDGKPLTAPDNESITIIGPSWHIAMDNIPMRPGDKDTLFVDPINTTLTYKTTRSQSPTIQASVSDTRAHYAFVIAGIANQPGGTLELSVPPEGGSLIISHTGSRGTSSVNLSMARSTEQGVQTFSHNAIPLGGADTAELQFGNWTDPSQGIPLIITHNGQQTTQTLTNQ